MRSFIISYNHLPKCAGTSLTGPIRSEIEADGSLSLSGHWDVFRIIAEYCAFDHRQLQKVALLYSHRPYGLLESLLYGNTSRESFVFSILREPRERSISHISTQLSSYKIMRYSERKGSPMYGWDLHRTLPEYIDDFYCKYLTNHFWGGFDGLISVGKAKSPVLQNLASKLTPFTNEPFSALNELKLRLKSAWSDPSNALNKLKLRLEYALQNEAEPNGFKSFGDKWMLTQATSLTQAIRPAKSLYSSSNGSTVYLGFDKCLNNVLDVLGISHRKDAPPLNVTPNYYKELIHEVVFGEKPMALLLKQIEESTQREIEESTVKSLEWVRATYSSGGLDNRLLTDFMIYERTVQCCNESKYGLAVIDLCELGFFTEPISKSPLGL